MSDPTFIEEIEPETLVSLAVCFRRQDGIRSWTVPQAEAATAVAVHASRDPDARHVMHVIRTDNGILSLDMDEVASISVVTRKSQVKSLLTAVELLTS